MGNTRKIIMLLLFLFIWCGLVTIIINRVQTDHKQGNENDKSTVVKKINIEPDDKDAIPAKEQVLHFLDAYGEWHDTIINEAVRKHDYDYSKLIKEGQEVSYEDEKYYSKKGIDVSHHQGDIDFAAVADAGYEFVILRCAYRGYGMEGTLNEDRKFREYAKAASAAGLEISVYIFSQAINEIESLEEAEFVADIIKEFPEIKCVVYDPELIRDDIARTDEISGEQFSKNTIAFCEKVKEYGYMPMIYSNMVWEAELFDMEALQEYPFWYADYERIPQTPYDFEYWQYSEKGQVPGIDGLVDLDIRICDKGK